MPNYFKNTELAECYGISEATVRNWIKSTKEGKLQLELIVYENKSYVANSISNIALIENIVEQNRKYRNTNAVKTVAPEASLLEIFNEAQVYDIVRNLELHRDIPRQYGYFAEAAHDWDDYINKQMASETPSMLRRSIELIDANLDYLDRRLQKFKKVNVIDIGVGNAVPVKNLLTHLIAQGKLGRYAALDFSSDMLTVAKQHLSDWFGSSFQFEGYRMDMTHTRFTDILTKDYSEFEPDTASLVLVLGATPNNLRVPEDAFRTICESMSSKDFLVYTGWVEPTENVPEWFSHSYNNGAAEKFELLNRHRFVLDRLGIKDSLYIAKVGFDKAKRRKYAYIELKFALNLRVHIGKNEKVVRFEKGDKILVWYYWQWTHRNVVDILESSGFYVAHSSQTEDRYIITVAEVQRG